MKMKRILSLFMVAAIIAGIGHGFMPQAVFAAPETELVAGGDSRVVRSEPSEYGYIDEYAVDENGNRIYPARTDKISLMADEELPSSYRSEYVTPVRNQGREGTCCAHAGIGAMEANLVKKGLADKDSVDFSEAHMTYFGLTQRDAIYNDGINYNDLWGKGGDTWDFTAMLQKWSGLELEENMPYAKYAGQTAIDEEKRFNSWARLKKLEYIDTGDKTAIKNAIMQYGAVFLGYKNDINYYNEGKYFYYANKCNAASHAVLLVGWDDSISAENFAEGSDGTTPAADGAWIIKNNWGESWGDNGYFYMSYENAIRELCVFDADLAGEYDNNYGYTGAPWSGYSNTPYTSANVFTAEKNEVLKAICVTVVQPTDIDIYIFKNLTGSTPDEGELVLHQRHSMTGMYEEIALNEEIPLAEGEKFSVVIDGACVYYEWRDGNYSYKAGESYLIPYNINYNGTHASSLNGSKSLWTDTATGKNEYTTLSNWIIGNAYIRAYTDNEGSTSTPKPIPTPVPTKTKLLKSWDFEDENTAFTNINADRATMSVVNGMGENTTKVFAGKSGALDYTSATGNMRTQLDFSEYIPNNATGVKVEFDAADFTTSKLTKTRMNYLLYDSDARIESEFPYPGMDTTTGSLFWMGEYGSNEAPSYGYRVNDNAVPPPDKQWVHVTVDADYKKNTYSYSITSLDGMAVYSSDKNTYYYDTSCNKITGLEIINWASNTTAYIDNITLYSKTPIVEYNVTLNTNGGTINSGNIEKYEFETGAPLPTDVTKNGYWFVGWYDNAECTGEKVLAISEADEGDKEYWAKWTDVPPAQYKIKFVNHDNSVLQEFDVMEGLLPKYTGETPTKPSDAQYTYTFDGWQPEIAAATAAATYTAKFKSVPKEYTVTLNTDGGTVNSGNVKKYTYGVGATLPTNVTKENGKFEGWYDNAACTGTAVTTITATDTGDKEYWAKWREQTIKKYSPAKVRNEIGSEVEAIDSDKVWLNGYDQWWGAAYFGYNGIEGFDPSLVEKATLTFTPVEYGTKNKNRQFYFELFGTNNNWAAGSATVSSNPYPSSGTRISSTSCQTNNGNGDVLKPNVAKEFDITDYVKKQSKGTSEMSFIVAIPPGSNGAGAADLIMKNNPTLTITMTKTGEQSAEYNVTLNANGGTINGGNITKYTFGTGATLPTNVTRNGYTFGGWYDNAACTGTAVTAITPTDTGDKTYYAKWIEIEAPPTPPTPKLTKTWDFEDGQTAITDVKGLSLSVINGTGGNTSKVLSATATSSKPRRAWLDLSSDIPDNAIGVRVEFDASDFTNSGNTRMNYILYDGSKRQIGLNYEDISTGSLFQIGYVANQTNFCVNNAAKTAPTSSWAHVAIDVNYQTNTTSYTVTSMDGTTTYLSGNDIAYYDTACSKVTGLEIFNRSNGTTVYIDNIELYVTEPNITDYDVKFQSDGSVIAAAPEAGTHCVIFAAYKNGVLTSVKTADAVFTKAQKITVQKPNGFVTDGADTVKVMMWKSLTDMQPLCNADIKQ